MTERYLSNMIECDESNARAVYKLLPSIEGKEGFPGSSAGKESAYNAGDPGSIPGSGSSLGEGIGYPLQYSWASLVAQMVKKPPVMQNTRFNP